MSFFWATRTNIAAFHASKEAAEAKGTARAVGRGVEDLEVRLDRALMACEAMWSLLRDKLGLTDLELLDRINEVDLSDGQLDGKVRKTAVSCPSCGRTIATRFSKCMYCGQAVTHEPFA